MKSIFTFMFIAALFIINKIFTQTRSPSTDRCIKGAWYKMLYIIKIFNILLFWEI